MVRKGLLQVAVQCSSNKKLVNQIFFKIQYLLKLWFYTDYNKEVPGFLSVCYRPILQIKNARFIIKLATVLMTIPQVVRALSRDSCHSIYDRHFVKHHHNSSPQLALTDPQSRVAHLSSSISS